MNVDAAVLQEFKNIIWDYYRLQGRFFDWRHVEDPYKIVISEIMLQQTQTHRVAQKYSLFLTQFPTFERLANASLKEVLSAWQGLGYNRRGKFLHETAKKVMQEYHGKLPEDPIILQTFPGIGYATARSIATFAFNRPEVFIETNIRAVYLYSFFRHKENITDKQLLPLVQATVDQESPRDWYYALMDYGVMLKKKMINPSRKSAHHAVQSKFEGSDRQIRGMILRTLTKNEHSFLPVQLITIVGKDPDRVNRIIQDLVHEKLLQQSEDGKLFI